MNVVFSYGTLTEKFPSAVSEKARLKCSCKLDSYGIYPALIETKDEMNIIAGDIIYISDKELEQADYYEGHPKLYKRIKKDVVLDDGSSVLAWVYFLVKKS